MFFLGSQHVVDATAIASSRRTGLSGCNGPSDKQPRNISPMNSTAVPASDAESYLRTVEVFDALRAVIPKFAERKAFIRQLTPVTPSIQRELPSDTGTIRASRDRAVCALVNKACNTHAAVRLLTDAGHGDDAMALGRVLLENTIILRWLLIDPIYRLDLFCISDALYQRRWSQLIEKHFQEKPELVAHAKAQVNSQVLAIAEFFGNTIHRWAQVLHPNGDTQHVNFEAMMSEVAKDGGGAGVDVTFQHDVIYFLHSGFVHSTASSMRTFRGLIGETYFCCDLGPNNLRCDEALGGANLFLLQVLQAATVYLGFPELEAELDALFAQMQASIREQQRSR